MSKSAYCIIDGTRGIVGICTSQKKANELCAEYCEMEYHNIPELVEDVWIEEQALNALNY